MLGFGDEENYVIFEDGDRLSFFLCSSLCNSKRGVRGKEVYLESEVKCFIHRYRV